MSEGSPTEPFAVPDSYIPFPGLAAGMPDVASESVLVDGHRIHYLHGGSGPTLLLLHGGIIDAAHVSWGEVIEPLTGHFHVVAPDLLGYGDSERPDVDYTMERHTAVVREFVETLDLAPVSVVGLSMGGGVGIGLALSDADMVERLVLVDAYGLGGDLPNGKLTWLLARLSVLNKISMGLLARSPGLVKASLGNIASDPDELSPEVVDEVYALAKQPGAGRPYRSFRASEATWRGARTDYTPRLPEIDVPTLLIHGAEDGIVPVEWARRAADRIPDARLEILQDVAHWPPREAPETVVDLLDGFCR